MNYDEFVEKYGDAEVSFDGYNKYVFSFSGFYDNMRINVDVGGDADDIYRLDISSRPLSVRGLYFNSASATKNGKVVDEFFDF